MGRGVGDRMEGSVDGEKKSISAVHSISRKDDQKKIELFFISTQLHSKSHDLSYELCLFELLNSIPEKVEQGERVLITKFERKR